MNKKFTCLLVISILAISTIFAQNGIFVTYYPFEGGIIGWDTEILTEKADSIAFDFGAEGPGDRKDNFAVVFSGYISPEETGDYHFEMFHNDGYIFLLDLGGDGLDKVNLDNYLNDGDSIGVFFGAGQTTNNTEALDPIHLEKGASYEFVYAVMEINNTTRGYLKWKLAGDAEYVKIPLDVLYFDEPAGVGVNNIGNSNNIKIFPNPVANGLVNIGLSSVNKSACISVFDIMGKIHYHQSQISGQNIQLELNSGIYFVKCTTDKETYCKKIIVK